MDLLFLNEELNKRYLTLEGNIKAKNNAFYDSYLDLIESTIKYILNENNIPYDSTKTCGHIVKEENVRSFLINVLKIDEFTYSKIPDYVKKCNDHKHKKEKNLELDGVINFMQLYYNFLNYYLDFKGLNSLSFDSRYYINIFNEVIKNELQHNENYLELAKKTENIEEKVDVIYEKIRKEQLIEEEKQRNIYMQNFVKYAKKYYIWCGEENEFKKEKKIVLLLFLPLLIIGIISTILTTKTIGFYTTYSLFENIWLFASIFIFFHVLVLKHKINDEKLMNNSIEHFEFCNLMYWKSTYKQKKRYKVFRIISYICCFLNGFYFIFDNNLDFSLATLIFEMLFFALSLIFQIFVNRVYDGYGFEILFENQNNPKEAYVLIQGIGFVSKEEAMLKYKKK